MLSREGRPQTSKTDLRHVFEAGGSFCAFLEALLGASFAYYWRPIAIGRRVRAARWLPFAALLAIRVASAQDEEVVVTGVRPQPTRLAREPGLAGSTLHRDRLVQPGGSLGDALREAPGVQVSQSGGLGAPATARLRGATAAQTPVYLGKIKLNDEVGGVADLSTVPHFFLKRVEVYRSHSPQFLSAPGLGGAIVLVPVSPTQDELLLQGEWGSFSTRAIRAAASQQSEAKQRAVLVAGEVQAAENDYFFDDSRGALLDPSHGQRTRLSNADAESGAVWALATQKLGTARVELLSHYARREQGAPKLALVPSEEARIELERGVFAVESSIPIGDEGDLFRASTRIVTGSTVLDDPQLELGATSPYIRTAGERLEQEFEGQHELGKKLVLRHMWTFGVERLRRIERRARVSEPALAAKRLSVRGAAAASFRPLQPLVLEALFAGRCFDTSQGMSDMCSEWAPTGRGSVRFQQRVWEVFANVGRDVRLPTLSELYGVGLLVRGNPSLRMEQGTATSGGARVQIPRSGARPFAWGEIAGFSRTSSDLLTYVRTAQGYLHPVNRKSSRTLGGELAIGTRLYEPLLVEGNISLLDPRDTSPDRVANNDILPFLSRLTTLVRAEYEWKTGQSRLSAVTVGARHYFQSSRYADRAGLGVIPSQSATDLELGVRAFQDAVSARGRVSNLFNVDRFDVVGFPLPGRSAFFSIEARL